MNGKGITLLAIAAVAIGTFALPGTVSLFGGQHTWYDLSESIEGASGRNNVPCEKCHADVAEEMTSGANGVHRDLTCAMCHRAPFTGYTYARGHYYIGSTEYAPTPGEEAHAASTVACMDCHGGTGDGGTNHWSDREYAGKCSKCHGPYDLTAGGFGLTPRSYDSGTKAAHKTFVLNAINNTDMEGANEACIACHTHIAVKINWTHRYSLEFNASFEDGLYPPTHFNVSDWKVNGTVNVTVYGNGSGGGSTSGWP
ncbi:MAG: hypothetical protein ISS94_01510 [Candidatus Syntrophoarchaeum sp.]|nr:hypothetical protein [Methanomicrobia archaeon]MBL7117450.1 hypothetical protein [Candidatus Syntrophoarchaeum sp.]